jgi:uncharacterized protein (TIRG00374 family)
LKKYIQFIILFLLTAVLLWWFGRSLNWAEIKTTIGNTNVWLLLLAALFVCAGYLIRAFRWRTLLAPITPASLKELFAPTTIGFGAVFLLGRTGEIVRPVVLPLRDHHVNPGASFVTIGLERICDMMAVAIIFAINLLWFPIPKGHTREEFALFQRAGMIMIGLVVFGIIVLILFRLWSNKIIPLIEKLSFIPKRLRDIITGVLKNLAQALGIMTDAKEFATIVGWTALLWTAIAFATFLTLRAFHLPYDFSDSLFVMGWALVGSLIPTPGGAAGAFHEVTKRGLVFLNVQTDQAAAVAIVMHLIFFAPALFIGLYFFLTSELSLSRLREILSSRDKEHAIEEEVIREEKAVQKT